MSFSLLLLISGCSLLPTEKIVAEQVIVKPTITIVEKPRPIDLYDADIVVITEENLPEKKPLEEEINPNQNEEDGITSPLTTRTEVSENEQIHPLDTSEENEND